MNLYHPVMPPLILLRGSRMMVLIRKFTEVNDVITSSELNRAGFLDVILIVVPDKDSLKKILKRAFYGDEHSWWQHQMLFSVKILALSIRPRPK